MSIRFVRMLERGHLQKGLVYSFALERMIEARVSRVREFFEGMVPVQAFSKITLTLAPPKPLLLLMIR